MAFFDKTGRGDPKSLRVAASPLRGIGGRAAQHRKTELPPVVFYIASNTNPSVLRCGMEPGQIRQARSARAKRRSQPRWPIESRTLNSFQLAIDKRGFYAAKIGILR